MEGKGTPKNEQNQFCHSPAVKAMTPSEVERQDSHAAGVKCSLRDLSPSLMQAVKMECRGSASSASGAASHNPPDIAFSGVPSGVGFLGSST